MKKTIRLFLPLLILVSLQNATADKLCIKNKLKTKNGIVNLKQAIRTSTSTECPAGYQEFFDTDSIDKYEFSTSLPSGKTMRGAFYVGGSASASGQLSIGSLNFPFQLPDALSSGFVHFIKSGQALPTGCSGSSIDPQADAGHLCIYEYIGFNAGARGATAAAVTGDNTVTKFGGGVYLYSSTSGIYFTSGHWAYTSP